MSNPNGCGFRVECFDPNDLSRFDVEIEKYEAWIQNYRKTQALAFARFSLIAACAAARRAIGTRK